MSIGASANGIMLCLEDRAIGSGTVDAERDSCLVFYAPWCYDADDPGQQYFTPAPYSLDENHDYSRHINYELPCGTTDNVTILPESESVVLHVDLVLQREAIVERPQAHDRDITATFSDSGAPKHAIGSTNAWVTVTDTVTVLRADTSPTQFDAPLVVTGECSVDQQRQINHMVWAGRWAYDRYANAVRAGERTEDRTERARLWSAMIDAEDALSDCSASRAP